MGHKIIESELVQIEDITPTVRELTIRPKRPEGLKFEAGQFVMIQLPPEDGKPVQRAYSIASSSENHKEFKLVIKHFPGGKASAWVQTLTGGESIAVTGPFGKFQFRKPPEKRVVFVCTSTGLAPFYSMLTSDAVKFADRTYLLYMGVWKEDEIFYEDQLKKISLPHFKFNFVLDSPTPIWKGLKGRVTEPLSQLDYSIPTQFYLCGNPAMIDGVKLLLESKGVGKENIFTESYG